MRAWHWLLLVVILLSAAALAARRVLRETVEREEGRVPYVYKDSAGIDTFGVGHRMTAADGELRKYTKANPAPAAVVDAVFDRDIAEAEAAVDALPLTFTDNERAALVSLVFNIGTGAFSRSTLRARLLSGDKAAAADEFLRWKFAGGQPVLLARRERERELFLA